jgi:predicted nuclease with RNAse H fold
MRKSAHIAVGVDVGGAKKGFHAVALREGQFLGKFHACTAEAVVAWCTDMEASTVGVDAPCAWSLTGRRRPCERELAGLGIQAFATPCLATGHCHPFYAWMLNGAELFRLLAKHYDLYNGRHSLSHRPLCFETFPHAIACALAANTLLARDKRVDRRRLLNLAGIATDHLRNIDEVDAALCALTSHRLLSGHITHYGEEVEGFIVVPSAFI